MPEQQEPFQPEPKYQQPTAKILSVMANPQAGIEPKGTQVTIEMQGLVHHLRAAWCDPAATAELKAAVGTEVPIHGPEMPRSKIVAMHLPNMGIMRFPRPASM